MERHIDSTIHQIYQDFSSAMQARGRLCECKDLTYGGGNQPDYSDALLRHYYLLRYFPAYLAEYYLMYRKLLDEFKPGESISVLSIGCGCMIDYKALKFALQSFGFNGTSVRYVGIDPVSWKGPYTPGDGEIMFVNEPAESWTGYEQAKSDVVVFPKSIGDDSGHEKLIQSGHE